VFLITLNHSTPRGQHDGVVGADAAVADVEAAVAVVAYFGSDADFRWAEPSILKPWLFLDSSVYFLLIESGIFEDNSHNCKALL